MEVLENWKTSDYFIYNNIDLYFLSLSADIMSKNFWKVFEANSCSFFFPLFLSCILSLPDPLSSKGYKYLKALILISVSLFYNQWEINDSKMLIWKIWIYPL